MQSTSSMGDMPPPTRLETMIGARIRSSKLGGTGKKVERYLDQMRAAEQEGGGGVASSSSAGGASDGHGTPRRRRDIWADEAVSIY